MDLAIDGISGANESRFINHSPNPNLGAIREGKWGIVFYSLDDISKGDELTFNYGFDPNGNANSGRRRRRRTEKMYFLGAPWFEQKKGKVASATEMAR